MIWLVQYVMLGLWRGIWEYYVHLKDKHRENHLWKEWFFQSRRNSWGVFRRLWYMLQKFWQHRATVTSERMFWVEVWDQMSVKKGMQKLWCRPSFLEARVWTEVSLRTCVSQLLVNTSWIICRTLESWGRVLSCPWCMGSTKFPLMCIE